jgi:hypothetical protein
VRRIQTKGGGREMNLADMKILVAKIEKLREEITELLRINRENKEDIASAEARIRELEGEDVLEHAHYEWKGTPIQKAENKEFPFTKAMFMSVWNSGRNSHPFMTDINILNILKDLDWKCFCYKYGLNPDGTRKVECEHDWETHLVYRICKKCDKGESLPLEKGMLGGSYDRQRK